MVRMKKTEVLVTRIVEDLPTRLFWGTVKPRTVKCIINRKMI